MTTLPDSTVPVSRTLLNEVSELLVLVHRAVGKLGLRDQGNAALPHEVRMLALKFSKDLPGGDGTYSRIMNALHAAYKGGENG